VAFLAFMHLALFLALTLSPGNSLVSSWCDHSMLPYHTQPFNGLWSGTIIGILYQRPPFTTIHSIFFIQFSCLTVLSDNLSRKLNKDDAIDRSKRILLLYHTHTTIQKSAQNLPSAQIFPKENSLPPRTGSTDSRQLSFYVDFCF